MCQIRRREHLAIPGRLLRAEPEEGCLPSSHEAYLAIGDLVVIDVYASVLDEGKVILVIADADSHPS